MKSWIRAGRVFKGAGTRNVNDNGVSRVVALCAPIVTCTQQATKKYVP